MGRGSMIPTGIEESTAFTVIWWMVAALTVTSACLVILSQDLLKAALALVVSFLGIAGIFVLLNAEFLAVVQVLIYAGAIPILIIFAILLMRDVQRGSPFNRFRWPAILMAGGLLFLILSVVLNTDWNLLKDLQMSDSDQQLVSNLYADHTPALGGLLFKEYALALEVAALILLSAALGAMALVRES
ncbi:NADH-quinone oxidoreductase subunit J [SAR202 cluster bacterium AD-802-E10_MRT_200m]|nr:NADH-quinone oxidoreductase subunit J [SAR202 cluster bacterium AD-802-E10_MRT_200m]